MTEFIHPKLAKFGPVPIDGVIQQAATHSITLGFTTHIDYPASIVDGLIKVVSHMAEMLPEDKQVELAMKLGFNPT